MLDEEVEDVVVLELDVVVLGLVVVVVVPRREVVVVVAGGMVVVLVMDGSSRPSKDPGGTSVVEGVVVEDVVEELEELVGGPGSRPSRRSSPRPSGEAVNTCSTGTPATAGFMAAAQMRAGNDPPVTRWPWTSVMGTILSGYPTQTAVDNCGTNPTNHASP